MEGAEHQDGGMPTFLEIPEIPAFGAFAFYIFGAGIKW